MPHLLPKDDILKLIENQVIQGGKRENAEGIKYDFTLGSRILKSKFKVPIDATKLSEIEKADLFVQPGEVVFVLSEERLALPKDIYIVLVPKRKLSHDGVMIMGGLSVDPYYQGRLLIGIYNFASSPFHLIPGKKIVGAHFYQLRDDEINNAIVKPGNSIDDFPEELIRLMEKYTPISTQGLLDKVTNIDNKLEDFKRKFDDRDTWFDKFQTKLDMQERNVENLISGLNKERDNRIEAEKELGSEVKIFRAELKDYSRINYNKFVWASIVGAIVLSFVIWAIQTWIINKNDRNMQSPQNTKQSTITVNIDSSYLNSQQRRHDSINKVK